jgi:FkbM family methyltransferase
MRGRLSRAVDKLIFCLGITADLISFCKLMIGHKLFSQSRRLPKPEVEDTYHLMLSGEDHKFCLRRFAGDLDIFFEVFWNRTYRLPVGHIQQPILSVLDLGANTGISTAYFYTCFPDAKFYCVEPLADHIRLLETNLSGLIPIDNLQWLQAAIGSKDGSGALIESRYTYNTKVKEDTDGSLKVISMPSVFSFFSLEEVDLVKMDIEGAEAVVFADPSCQQWLPKTEAIAIELHDDSGFGPASDLFHAAIRDQRFQISHSGELTICLRADQAGV